MSNKKSFIAGIFVTLAAAFALLMLTGAVTSKTPNYKPDMGLRFQQYAAMHVACSADGRTVYIADDSRIQRSIDAGNNWQVVMTNKKNENSQQ
jgi:hypothetical protein